MKIGKQILLKMKAHENESTWRSKAIWSNNWKLENECYWKWKHMKIRAHEEVKQFDQTIENLKLNNLENESTWGSKAIWSNVWKLENK